MEDRLGLTFTIHPDSESASLDLFWRSIGDIKRLLVDVDYAVNRERNIRRWIIAGLHSSAPMVTVRPLATDAQLVDVIAEGIRTVTIGTTEPPRYFTEDALADLKRMKRLFTGRDRATRIVVSRDAIDAATISSSIGEKADQILSASYHNLGSLDGKLEAINVHDAANFTIWDRVSLAPVRCYFPKSWLEKIKSLLEKRVSVRGDIRYFRNGVPRSVINVQALEDATQDSQFPEAYFGCVPDEEAAKDVVAFLQERRGTFNRR